jgi:hypothetical protein
MSALTQPIVPWMQMVMMGQLMHALSAATDQQTAGLESYVNTCARSLTALLQP